MKKLDFFLSDYRQKIAEPFIKKDAFVLDLGGYDGSFLRRVQKKISKGICLDPLTQEKQEGNIFYLKTKIVDCLPFNNDTFDIVCMLAVFEHFGDRKQQIAKKIYRVLKKDGLALLTVPHKIVDSILNILIKLRLLDGMSYEEHEGFDHRETIQIFESAGFKLTKWVKFQIGLNNLFVFEKISQNCKCA